MPESNKIDLSVVILNYNSGNYLRGCLESIDRSVLGNYRIEVLIPDNNSDDGSLEAAQKKDWENKKIRVKFLPLKDNRGFAHGNNQAIGHLSRDSRMVLFLNPDTKVGRNSLRLMLDFFEEQPDADAATCKIILVKTGKMQPECHRGFPTPWRGFWHFFGLGIPKLFPKSALFNGYFLGHLDVGRIHQIEACVGAFLMVRRPAGEAIGWWNEKYEFYGDDLDFCYKLSEKGYKLFFVPTTTIWHYQGISSGIKGHSAGISQANKVTKIRSANNSIVAMRIFYEDHLAKNYPFWFNKFVLSGIKLMEIFRKARIYWQ